MKNRKVSISLPEHVYSLGLKKAKLTNGNNFSNYVNSLICKEFTQDELSNEYIEVSKPLCIGNPVKADLNTICQYCKSPINPGQIIYPTDLGFTEEYKNWVHEECCRKK